MCKWCSCGASPLFSPIQGVFLLLGLWFLPASLPGILNYVIAVGTPAGLLAASTLGYL